MAPYTALCTVGPNYPIVYYRFPSREVHDQWVDMVDRTRSHMTERASHEIQMSWTSDGHMVRHMAEFFRLLEQIVHDFGIQMVPPDVYCAAQTCNRILENLGRPRMDAFDRESSASPQHAGCEIRGMYRLVPDEQGRGTLVPFRPSS